MNRLFLGGRARVWLGLAWLSFSATGCGHDPFAAPSRPNPPSTASPVESVKSIFMILPRAPEGDLELWAIWAHRESNDQHLVFRSMGPGPGESATAQPDLVRRAVADGASALLVVPGDSPDLARSLADAEAKGVPVVLIGRPIPAPPGSKPFPLVTHAPFEESAGRIVATTLGDAKKAGRPADGPALILVDKVTDPTSADRVAALKAAAEAAGLKRVETVPFDGSERDSAKKAVLDAVRSHPDVAIVLADDSEAMRGASDARIGLEGKPAFFVGGYIGHRAEPPFTGFGKESCFVDGRIEQLGRMAALKAIAMIRGGPEDGRSTPKVEFTRGSAEIATAEKPEPTEVIPAQPQNPTTGPVGGDKPK